MLENNYVQTKLIGLHASDFKAKHFISTRRSATQNPKKCRHLYWLYSSCGIW